MSMSYEPRIKRNIGRMIDQGATEAEIDSYLAGEGVSAQTPTNSTSVMSDIAQTIPAGLARGTAALVGLPGEVAGLGATGIDYAAKGLAAGASYLTGNNIEAPQRPSGPPLAGFSLPDSADITRAVEGVTGPLYKPQTTPGKYVNTAAEFAPNMISPGTMARRAIGGVLAPAIASKPLGNMRKEAR